MITNVPRSPLAAVLLAAAVAVLAGCSSPGGRAKQTGSRAPGIPATSVTTPWASSTSSPAPSSRTRSVGPAGGPSSPAAAGGKVTDACTLLPRSEAQQIVRTPITRVQKQPVGPFVTCGYYGRAVAPLLQIQVNANPYTRTQFERTARGVGADATPLPGVGDAAYSYPETPGYVVVLKGSVFFQIDVGNTRDDAATAQAVARKVAARL